MLAIDVISVQPRMFDGFLTESIVARAVKKGACAIRVGKPAFSAPRSAYSIMPSLWACRILMSGLSARSCFIKRR